MWSFTTIQKKGPVVDSKKNTLVLRGEVSIFAANKNAHSICVIVWSISCIIYRTRWMWCEFKSALECVFRSFWFLNQRNVTFDEVYPAGAMDIVTAL